MMLNVFNDNETKDIHFFEKVSEISYGAMLMGFPSGYKWSEPICRCAYQANEDGIFVRYIAINSTLLYDSKFKKVHDDASFENRGLPKSLVCVVQVAHSSNPGIHPFQSTIYRPCPSEESRLHEGFYIPLGFNICSIKCIPKC